MTTAFSLEHLETLHNDSAKTYITKYFIPLTNGTHAVLQHNNTYELMEHAVVKKTYFDRMDPRLSKFYFKEYLIIRNVVYELGKRALYDNKLNLCQQFKHEPKPYETFDTKTKEGVDTMLNYMKEVLCSDSVPQYEYLVKWFANMAKGKKNDSILYLKGGQGIGKSTVTQFMMNHVIGRPLSLETGAESLISKFNIELGGKLLVVFEELEHLSTNEWNSMSTKLKRYSTSDTIMLESKGEKRFESSNINNYMILSNHDCIKDDDGRRVYILDVSPKYKGNLVYFGKIRDQCFNDKVGEAFFSYLHEVDTTNFYAQRFPMTQSKLDAFAKRLHPIEQYLKDEYVLTKKSLDNSVQNIFDEYKLYCEDNGIRNTSNKIDFNKKMVELGFNHYKSSFKGKSSNKYKIDIKDLDNVAKIGHWVHTLDEYVEKCEKNIINMCPDDEYRESYEVSQTQLKASEGALSLAMEEIEKQRKVMEDMERQAKDFYNQIEALKKQLESKPTVKKPIKHKTINNMMDSDNEEESDGESEYESDSDEDEDLDVDDDEYDNMANLLSGGI